MTDWQRANDQDGRLLQRAALCELWGKRAADMTRDELLVFVAMLDELATQRQQALTGGGRP